MRFVFLVEDSFGRIFFKKFFAKKAEENIFSGQLKRSYNYPPGSKMGRIISANSDNADRIIVIADADGKNREEMERRIYRHVGSEHANRVRVVMLDYEIEEWICYSQGIKFDDQKPSDVLSHKKGYQKKQLPAYAERLDCKKLQDCGSFRRLLSALE